MDIAVVADALGVRLTGGARPVDAAFAFATGFPNWSIRAATRVEPRWNIINAARVVPGNTLHTFALNTAKAGN